MAATSRREFLARSASGILLGFLGPIPGCAPGDEETAGEGRRETWDRRAPGGTIAHRYGGTAAVPTPERVIPLTVRDQDTALALGVVPAAVRGGFYRERYAEWPWVRPLLGEREPPVLPEGHVNFERIAASEPDLVLGAASGLTAREYAILSRLCPVLGPLSGYGDYGAPWHEVTRAVGGILGRRRRAERHIADVERAVARARAAHPRLQGATGIVGVPGGAGGVFWAYGPQDGRARFLASMGLELPDEVASRAGDRFAITVSPERLDLFDVDVVIWLATDDQRRALREHPIYQRLDVAREGREVFLAWDGLETAALTNTSALNLPFLLDSVLPRIAEAIEGRSRRAA